VNRKVKTESKKEFFLYSIGEECLNAITHGIAALLSLIGLVVLLICATKNGNPLIIISTAIYSVTLFTLYLSSTLYHSLSRTRARFLFQKFDHISIYLLIAGTYTPISLCIIKGALGWTIFGMVWGMALFGIIFKAIFGAKYDLVSTVLYVMMGWLILLAYNSFTANLASHGLALFFLGGLFYTFGVYYYLKGEQKKWFHGIWHFFVAGGSLSHYIAILYYVIPASASTT
jgi:hemolysin III